MKKSYAGKFSDRQQELLDEKIDHSRLNQIKHQLRREKPRVAIKAVRERGDRRKRNTIIRRQKN